jgi:hypothetical protein
MGIGGLILIGVVAVMVTLRVRSMVWFATGVVLAVLATVLVMQTWRVDAAPGDTDSTFVPTSPCRLFDYRTAPHTVGPRSAPLGAGETHVQQVTGSNGDCTGALAIPGDAVAVAMNVTAVNPTAQSNLRVFPADVATVPTVSNLNFSAGQQPVPNKVDVKLSPDGKIKLFNAAGSVSVVGDIVGYYTNSTLVELANSRPIARSASTGSIGTLPTPGGSIVLSVTIDAPVTGLIQVAASAQVDDVVGDLLGGNYTCNLAEGAGNVAGTGTLGLADRVAVVGATEAASCSTNGALAVTKGTYVINLVLGTTANVASGYEEATLDAIFVAGGSTT